MEFLRRVLHGSPPDGGGDAQADPAEADTLERTHELELARGERERLDDLQQRQLRYADHAWQPPSQGGEIRAEDADKPPGS